MTDCAKRLTVLTFVGNYLPGYKAGGILRSLVNAVDHLSQEFDFKIVTRDRDLGDRDPYPGVRFNQWQRVFNADVLYLRPAFNRIGAIRKLISETPHDVVYLNSFFDPFTIMVLLIRKLGPREFKNVIVAPRGEFAWGALGQKHLKKALYIRLAKAVGLYRGVTWHASSRFEASDIMKVMGAHPGAIHTALDLPTREAAPYTEPLQWEGGENGRFMVVFLSRIARVKNLKYALEILEKVKAQVTFHIYGPMEAADYWEECQGVIERLPANVQVEYLGCVAPSEVVTVFSRYHLFLFPTTGENYGHVIAEALTSGTPVLISNQTPWRNLATDGLGWDLDLADLAGFVEKVERFSRLSGEERREQRRAVRRAILDRLLDPAVLEANRELFRGASSH